jgi:hypothetical protein
MEAIAELKRRRIVLDNFVAEHLEYLNEPFYAHSDLRRRKYFEWSAREVIKVISGREFTYQLPRLGSPGSAHSRNCLEMGKYGKSVSDLDILEVSPLFPEGAGIALAHELLHSSEKLSMHINNHSNFWLSELSVSREQEGLSKSNQRDIHRQLDILEDGLSFRVIRAIKDDEETFRQNRPSGMRGRFELDTNDDDRLHRFLKYVDLLRDECKHIENVHCNLCGNLFTPDEFNYSTLGVGSHFCAFCVHAATDSVNDFYYTGVPEEDLSQLLDEGLSHQGKDVDLTLELMSQRDPNVEVQQELSSMEVSSMKPELAVESLSRLAVRPRQALTLSLGMTFEHFLYERSARNLPGAIASDNHFCQSKGELIICEYLTSRGISHSMHPRYADLVRDEDKALVQNYKGDFLLGTTILEFLGFGGSEYERRSNAKVKMARFLGLDIIEVKPSDLSRLDIVLDSFLESKGESPFLF